jgi:signal peptidase II
MPLRYRVFALGAVLTLLADQLSKWWARGSLVQGHPVTLIKNVWDWELSYNQGSAFGLFNSMESARIFLTVVGLAACAYIVYYLARKVFDDQKWLTSALGLVWGGALGNVIDRILDGKVTDFVLWHWKETRWPQFNIADAALVAGVLILAFDIGRDQRRHKKPEKT